MAEAADANGHFTIFSLIFSHRYKLKLHREYHLSPPHCEVKVMGLERTIEIALAVE
jgi:hypothetical protein